MRELVCLIAALFLLLGSACGDDAAEPAAAERDAEEETADEHLEGESDSIEVQMTEFAFGAPETVPSGEVEITVVNVGEQKHEMGVVPLSEGAPPVQDLLKLEEKELQQYMAGPFLGTERPIAPGEQRTFTLETTSGTTYAYACFVEDLESKKPHAFLGMYGSFSVE